MQESRQLTNRDLLSSVPIHLLSSNREPDSQEITALRNVIKQVQDEIESLKSSLPHLTREERKRLAALGLSLHTYTTILSPFRRFPMEILQNIFTFVAEGFPTNAAYRLNQVSQCWNEVARTTPFVLGTLPPICLPKKLKKNQFAQSFNSAVTKTPLLGPLFLQVSDRISNDTKSAAQILFSQSHRWHSVSIQIHIHSLSQVSGALENHTPALRYLKLSVAADHQRYQYERGLFGAFLDAPYLQEVELECLTPVKFFLPWWSLTRYKLRSYLPIGLSEVLRDDSVLEHFEYYGANPYSLYIAPFPTAVLNNLRSMEIIIYYGSPDMLLGPLTAPRLEKLRILDHTVTSATDLHDFLRRSSCGATLTSLSFHINPMAAGDLSNILLLTPSLTDLECNGIPASDILRLSVEEAGSVLVPLLQHLIIHSPTRVAKMKRLAHARSRITEALAERANFTLLESAWRHTFALTLVFQTSKQSSDAAEVLIPCLEGTQSLRTKLSQVLWEFSLAIAESKARTRRTGIRRLLKPRRDFGEKNRQCTVVHRRTYARELLGISEKDSIPQVENLKFNFCERADELFALCLLFVQGGGGSRKFIRHGRYCIRYLTYPVDDALTRYEQYFLHGRHKIFDDDEVFWPYKEYTGERHGMDYVKWRKQAGQARSSTVLGRQ
ncbi:LOW QUALITY PROTEIN: hypothetical protein CVT26_016155 [Gymnopilus dilepis]|uniref:F-box domain-containing protein n=1 Tax=Gymnopilus dilepis TaxID=231916 RepID=A0A409XYT4_9AGAR|nr:LOW QUALITY PROTEIN: hypothetical protein CVT26_016155 [Gymnopilus dilepis]